MRLIPDRPYHASRIVLGVIVIAALSSAPAALLAQEVWTLERAVATALDRDPRIAAASDTVARAQRELDAAWNLFLPDAALTTSLSYPLFDGEGATSLTAGVGAGASLTVPSAVPVRLARRRDELMRLGARERAEGAAVVADVRRRFFAVLLADGRLAIAERNVELADIRAGQVQQSFEQGRTSRLQLLDARAAALARRPELLSRRADARSRRAELAHVVGLPPNAPVDVNGTIALDAPQLSTAQIVARVVGASPELAAARYALARDSAQREVERASVFMPRLSARLAWSPSLSPAFASASWSAAETWRTGSATLSLSIPLDPLVPESPDRLAIDAAQDDLAQQTAALTELERATTADAWELAYALELSRRRVVVLQQAVGIARERYEATLAAFDSGGVELLSVQDAQADLEQAELDLLLERFAVVSALIDLDELAGGALLGEE